MALIRAQRRIDTMQRHRQLPYPSKHRLQLPVNYIFMHLGGAAHGRSNEERKTLTFSTRTIRAWSARGTRAHARHSVFPVDGELRNVEGYFG